MFRSDIIKVKKNEQIPVTNQLGIITNTTVVFLLLMAGCSSFASETTNQVAQPNVVLIFLDDAGFADFQPFAETRYPTPNVGKLAEEGRSFYNFYVPQAICSASRAALLTGTNPERNRLFGAHSPRERGLDPEFVTMAEMLQEQDYRTASFGKWHIGDHPETRPPERGFDESCGIKYSNDIWADYPVNPEYRGQYPLQYWKNGDVIMELDWSLGEIMNTLEENGARENTRI